MLATLDEKSRRRFVGLLALTAQHGGIQQLIEITGMSRNTIYRGRDESNTLSHALRATVFVALAAGGEWSKKRAGNPEGVGRVAG
jgi:hypothetical protein